MSHQHQRTRLQLKPRNHSHPSAASSAVAAKSSQPKASTRNPKEKFPYGNYDHYYGYRIQNKSHLIQPSTGTQQTGPKYGWEDPRLAFMDPEWFENKRVLDIGCNSGLITICIAKHFSPRNILGIDLDHGLVQKAKVLLGFQASMCTPQYPGPPADWSYVPLNFLHPRKHNENINPNRPLQPQHIMDDHYFPISMPLIFGSIPINRVTEEEATAFRLMPSCDQFPENIEFMTKNIMESPEWVEAHRGQFDTICALSLTKWIHIHRGDDGLVRFFQICFDLLSTHSSDDMEADDMNNNENILGGALILEPQPWSSYQRSLKLKPEAIPDLTLVPEGSPGESNSFWFALLHRIGFRSGEVIKQSENEGFQKRPMWILRK